LTGALRALGALALLALLFLVAVALLVDRIAAAAIEAGAAQATGVPARVGSAHVGLVAGRFTLRRFRLANPEGFGDGDLVSLGALTVDMPRNLFAQSLRIPELAVEGLDLAIEQKGARTNVGELLRRMESGAAERPAPEPGGRELVIERLVVRDATARLRVAGREPIPLRIPVIELFDVGARGSREQHVAEVVRRVLTAVLGAVARNPDLPRQLAGELAGGLRGLSRGEGALGDIGRRVGESAGSAARGIRELLRRGSE
jgi:hypothetical protein